MYKNLKIGVKLFIGFASVALLSVIMMFYALTSLSNVRTLSHNLYTGPYVSTTEAMGIRHDLNLMGRDIRGAIIDQDIEKYRLDIENAKTELDSRILTLKVVFGGDQQMVTNVEEAEKTLASRRDEVLAAITAKDYIKATELLNGSYLEAYTNTSNLADVLFNDADQRAAGFDATIQKTAATSLFVLIAMLAFCLGIAIFMAVASTRSITNPMKKVVYAVEQMAEGSLNVSVDYEANDELGILAKKMCDTISFISAIVIDIGVVLGEMADGNFNVKSSAAAMYKRDYEPILLAMKNIKFKLTDTLSQINMSSEQVSSGSDQVSSGAQALSQGATEQASSVEELAASVTEISGQVKENAQNARTASKMVEQTAAEVIHSNQKMTDLVTAMADISHSSQEIGKVIKTIEDIAFQTNILALNAAVEAARAGAAGKGFAVVADEVRNLASKSADAAKGTTALIEGAVSSVVKGTSLVDETAKALLLAVEGTKEITAFVNKISEASNEQAGSISQVNMGIEQISSVVQTNSATAEESAAASEELSGQAQMLKSLVGKFKFENNGDSSGAIPLSSYEAFSPPHLSNNGKY